MNKDTLIQYIQKPELVAKNDLDDLQLLSEKFPWFFPSHQLQLYYHKTHNDIYFNEYLSRWSLNSPDREKLFLFLNQVKKKVEVVETKVAEEKLPQKIIVEVVPEPAKIEVPISLPVEKVKEEPIVAEPEKPIQAPVIEVKAEPETIAEVQPEIIKEEKAEEIIEVVEKAEPVVEISVKEPEPGVIAEQPEIKIPEPVKEVVVQAAAPITPVVEEKPPVKEVLLPVEPPKVIVTPPAPVVEKIVVPTAVVPETKTEVKESMADIVMRRVAEIKKRREEEAAAAKKAESVPQPEVIATKPEVVPVVVPEVIAKVETAPEIVIVEPEALPEVFAKVEVVPEIVNIVPEVVPIIETIPAPEPQAEDYEIKLKISSLLADIPMPVTRREVKEVSADIVLPDDFYNIPVYDISMLEKDVPQKPLEEVVKTGTRTFSGWLNEIESATTSERAEESKPASGNKQKLIDRFITEKPNIVFKPASEDPKAGSAGDEEFSICSETLAEILASQKQYSQASEMYKKLSLLYPEKSIYFAGQIEKITQSEGNS